MHARESTADHRQDSSPRRKQLGMSRSEPDPPPPYLVRRRERALDTRRRLIHAATRLWSEKDYDATTVEDICAAAGVGRTTYYLHFVSKEQLLGELAFATAGGVSSDVADAMDVGDLDSQLCAFIDGLVRRDTRRRKDAGRDRR
jgi:AcrR family transcriptional regulator